MKTLKRYTEKEKFDAVSKWRASGMNQTQFALTIGIPSQTLNHWCVKYGFRKFHTPRKRKKKESLINLVPIKPEKSIEEQEAQINKLIREFKMHIIVFLFTAIYFTTLYFVYSK